MVKETEFVTESRSAISFQPIYQLLMWEIRIRGIIRDYFALV